MKSFLIFHAALLGALTGAAHAGDLIVDGSFEGQPQAVGTWGVYVSIPGWASDTGDGIELRNALAGAAFDGSNFAELDSHGNSAISQALSTLANVHYDLSFAYSPRAGVAADSNPIEVLWNGRLLASVTADGIGLNGLDWQVHHLAASNPKCNTTACKVVP